MDKESFQIISDRFLETAYGKSKEELLYLYQNNAQFKEDYDVEVPDEELLKMIPASLEIKLSYQIPE